ncbi:hypothetical protein INR49_016753 [Caranx melampygus]|nr:hypothetical protein INR49_016753 [Caranx melampygus]
MTNFECVVFYILIFHLKPTGAFPQSGLDMEGSRTRRGVTCSADLHYLHGNICCLNCPAGTHVKSPCTREEEKGECEECEHETFTEHSNGLRLCFKCTRCRTDQDVVRPCGSTHDTQCQCKSGRFCVPEEACEVCKKCSRCEEDEEVVRNCTPTTNTECKKILSNPGSSSAKAAVIGALVLGAGLLFLGIGCCWWKRFKATDTQSHLSDMLKGAQHRTDNRPTKERRNGESRKQTLALLSRAAA